MNILVTGAAGFIGSNLVDLLLEKNHNVLGIDNFSTGKKEFLSKAFQNNNFTIIDKDINDIGLENDNFKNIDAIFHLAANADVKDGPKHPTKDLKENTINTSKILEIARKNKINKIVFSSTGSVYGEHFEIPTQEDSSFPIQTSLYGASKLAGEGLLSSYSYAYGIQSYIFRFVSILGPRYTHGHVVDFFEKLKRDKSKLHILGDGTQKKSYLHVSDCIRALDLALNDKRKNLVNIYNIGTPEIITVKNSATIISKYLNLNPIFEYSGGSRGWIGDNPHIHLCCKKIKEELGWEPLKNIKDSLIDTLSYLTKN